MSILLTGGAGYIGSITNQYLQSKGIHTIVFDNLSEGHLSKIPNTTFFQGDITSIGDIRRVFSEYFIEGVIHFAAFALAGESMQKPHEYYSNNVLGTVNLLEVMREFGCKQIVFSSSCSVFGNPEHLPVKEDAHYKPESVYAETKMMGEYVFKRYDQLFDIHSVILRYFNASGASLDARFGEDHTPETHIIPQLLNAAKHPPHTFTLFGDDYPTSDGSCIRDYIHVLDLAQAHYLALKYLQKHNKSNHFNLGSEKGVTNFELVKIVEEVTGKKISVTVAPRRPGDPAAIYADAQKAKQLLGWQPEYSDIHTIVKTAWEWHQRL